MVQTRELKFPAWTWLEAEQHACLLNGCIWKREGSSRIHGCPFLAPHVVYEMLLSLLREEVSRMERSPEACRTMGKHGFLVNWRYCLLLCSLHSGPYHPQRLLLPASPVDFPLAQPCSLLFLYFYLLSLLHGQFLSQPCEKIFVGHYYGFDSDVMTSEILAPVFVLRICLFIAKAECSGWGGSEKERSSNC